ncbi:Malonyl CoA-acyl carrier protein transacylase [Alkalibacterium sp. AK22]|uniref:ACP S-malonyltransferase n=1 Tax=Alkalibacterium sp. AK22 TaxID=1229520 RepID=UPI0004459193|nr:ACP S-malonyltransferase [Alkalibacterium sp. AK22]EXJ24171.1 Malonyl CoA-acyl carrier protein transacylase [Alkalibacterium sp. AK22]
MKTAFVFSGQGAQYVGMGKTFYDAFPTAREVFDEASEALNLKLDDICFNDEKAIHFTPYTQPAILTVSHAIERVLAENGLSPDMTAGLSLGEYTALVSAEALSFNDAVRLVHKRGTLMEHAVPGGQGKMAAVIGLESFKIEDICKEVTASGHYVAVANYNTPTQLVLTGSSEGVLLAAKASESAGAKRVVELNVSGPFHSQLLQPAADEFRSVVEGLTFKEPVRPVYSNVDAGRYQEAASIPEKLTAQMVSSVHFEQMITQMIKDGAETFIEVGPGKTLRSFIKAIDRSVLAKNVENVSQFEKLIARN